MSSKVVKMTTIMPGMVVQEARLVPIACGAIIPQDITRCIAVATKRSVKRISHSGRMAIHPELGVGAMGM